MRLSARLAYDQNGIIGQFLGHFAKIRCFYFGPLGPLGEDAQLLAYSVPVVSQCSQAAPRHVDVTDQVSDWVHVRLALAVYPVLHANVHAAAPTAKVPSSQVVVPSNVGCRSRQCHFWSPRG